MTEPIVDQANEQTNGDPPKGTARKAPAHYVEEGAFPRLQERAQTQLGFINSLLITLAIGLLAFAANASTNASDLNRLGWWKWLLFTGLLLLASSVLAGLRLAFNRLASHRITTRVAQLRQLRDRYSAQGREYELQRLGRQSVFFQHWGIGSLSKLPEKHQVRSAANDLAALIPDTCKVRRQERPEGKTFQWHSGDHRESPVEPNVAAIAAATTKLVEALRSWYERADDWTWRWLRAQMCPFIAGAALLLVVPLSYYFFKHAGR